MTHATARHATLAEINITPLIDVLLVLAIIFLITAPVLARRIELQVNGDGRSAIVTPPQLVEVQVDGSVRWDGVLLPTDAIAAQMRVAAREHAPLRITAANGVVYDRMASVLAHANTAGVTAIDVPLDPR